MVLNFLDSLVSYYPDVSCHVLLLRLWLLFSSGYGHSVVGSCAKNPHNHWYTCLMKVSSSHLLSTWGRSSIRCEGKESRMKLTLKLYNLILMTHVSRTWYLITCFDKFTSSLHDKSSDLLCFAKDLFFVESPVVDPFQLMAVARWGVFLKAHYLNGVTSLHINTVMMCDIM